MLSRSIEHRQRAAHAAVSEDRQPVVPAEVGVRELVERHDARSAGRAGLRVQLLLLRVRELHLVEVAGLERRERRRRLGHDAEDHLLGERGFSPKYCVLRTSVSVRPASHDPRRYGPFASGFRLRGCVATSPPAHAAAERSGRLKASRRPAEAVLKMTRAVRASTASAFTKPSKSARRVSAGAFGSRSVVEREDDVRGRDGRAVLPARVLAQADRVDEMVGRVGDLLREARHEVQLLVVIEQIPLEEREDDLLGIRRREDRVERLRLAVEAAPDDALLALSAHAAGGERRRRPRGAPSFFRTATPRRSRRRCRPRRARESTAPRVRAASGPGRRSARPANRRRRPPRAGGASDPRSRRLRPS